MTEQLSPAAAAPTGEHTPSLDGAYREVRQRWLDELESRYFARLLHTHQRDVRAVATEAGVDRTYVYRLIKRHGL